MAAGAPGELDDLVAAIREATGDDEVSPDDAVLSTGILDSFAVADVLAFIEERLGVSLQVEDIGFDNADTPRQLLGVALAARDARGS